MDVFQPSGTTLAPLDYSYTGVFYAMPLIVMTQPFPVQVGSSLQNVAGKYVKYLNIATSNSALTTISFADVAGIETFTLGNLTGLTSLSFPVLSSVLSVFSSTAQVLTTFSVPALKTVIGNVTLIFPSLSTLSLPALTTVVGAFTTTTNSATSVSAPLLKDILGWSVSGTLISSVDFSSLTTVTTMSSSSLPALTTLSLPSVTDATSVILTNCGVLTSLTMPAIVRLRPTISSGSVVSLISGTAALTTFTLGTTIKQIGNGAGNIVITSAALTQASVDALLAVLAGLDGTNGTTAFSGRTVTITGTSATPSAAGLTSKATLVARGCTVSNN